MQNEFEAKLDLHTFNFILYLQVILALSLACFLAFKAISLKSELLTKFGRIMTLGQSFACPIGQMVL